MKKIIFIIGFIFISYLSTFAQTQCPQGLVCISQEAANKAAENARLIPQLENKILTLEDSIKLKDKNIEEIRETARKNEADLRERLTTTQIALGTATGELIGVKSENTTLKAMVEFLNKNGRKKCNFFSICL